MRRSIVWVILPVFCLFLLPCTVSAQGPEGVIPGIVSPQVTGTAGLSTGLVKIGHTPDHKDGVGSTPPPQLASIDWGDHTKSDPDYWDCTLKAGFPPYSSCDHWGEHTYQKPGVYTVKVSFLGIKLFSAKAVIDPIGNFVIVSVGDSVASGEGNPDVPPNLSPQPYGHHAYWSDDGSVNDNNNNGCSDQSAQAAPVLAAHMLQVANPATRVTIDHLACSGAAIHDVKNQILNMGLPPGQKIDALVMTVGADSVYKGGFSSIVEKCVVPPLKNPGYDCAQDPTFATDLDNGFDNNLNAGSSYNGIESAISTEHIPDANVYITEYFDPTHDALGHTPNLAETDKCTTLATPLHYPDEWSFLYSNVVIPLNRDVYAAAHKYKWHFVGGSEVNGTQSETGTDGTGDDDPGTINFQGPYFPIADDFTEHGFCVGRDGLPGITWVVGLLQSEVGQNWYTGTAHPNAAGQFEYAQQIVKAINYYTPPETAAKATSAGKPYTFGTWTTHDVEVTLQPTNKLATAGVGQTYFSEDDPTCDNSSLQSCLVYQGPFTMDQSGKHTLYFFSSNKSGTFEKQQSEQVWIDNAPPVMNCYATPSILWAPNHKLVPVSLNVTAVSAAFGATPFTLTSVTTSEGNPATDIQGFTLGKPSTRGWLRASRTGTQRAGRVYTFTYKSADPLGLTGSCATTVTVPHDRGRR